MTGSANSQTSKSGQAIAVFDAECVLCSANAQFILDHDRRKRFLLASIQGEYGRALYRRYNLDPDNPETLVVVTDGRLYRNSDAVLFIYSGLGWPWRIVSTIRLVPRFIRDPVYLLIARNRYRWFGKRNSCWLPSPEFEDRVI